MRIYIAGKLSSKEDEERTPSKVITDYIQNISRMCRVASRIRKKGHYPYVPGIDFVIGMVVGSWEEEHYRGMGMSFLEVCDAVLVISWSWGVRKEVERATELGIPVYYSLEELNEHTT